MNVFTAIDQNGNILKLDCVKEGNLCTVSIGKEMLKGVDTLDFMPHFFDAKVGDDGYYVYSCDCAYQTFFTEREDVHYESQGMRIPVMGATVNGKTTAIIVTKMAFAYTTVIGKKGDKYYA